MRKDSSSSFNQEFKNNNAKKLLANENINILNKTKDERNFSL